MSRLAARFAQLRARGERALLPFLTAGDPSLEATPELVLAAAAAGADAIEIGVPFSDPIAEGPVIQRASERALRAGANLRRVLQLVTQLRPQIEAPLLLMGYANPFYAMGAEAFAAGAAEAGVDGVICPDLPPEEGADFYAALAERGVDGVLMAGPTTTPQRLAQLARQTRGFLYYVSLTGVTGARNRLAPGIEAGVRAARQSAAIPICVGFGVSTPEQAGEIGRYADGVVVGSALVSRIEEAANPGAAAEAVARFVAALKAPLAAGDRAV
ncbi:MAG: tryptophan synthase subunit alpha [Deltaproteobacteria bacterium]|nr:tryptophan synthase subunit alpha [Deltaproteobacteria bacterium]